MIKTNLLHYFFVLLLLTFSVRAEQAYQQPADFIRESLGELVKPSVIWPDKQIKSEIETILAHPFNKLRIKYWQREGESVWILDEIGKEAPITVGIHLRGDQIERIKVLVYRESRGDEVRHAFFTDQFKSARLNDDFQLNKHIDGITGATLSVRALTKMSRLALYLNSLVGAPKAP